MTRRFGLLVCAAVMAMADIAVARADEVQTLRELPPLLRAVSDEPGVLSPAEGQMLSRRISEIEQETRVKLVALVVVTVVPETIDVYVQRLIDHWKHQGRALDNGRFVFVVIARNDRELRIVPGPELAWLLKPLAGNGITEVVPKLLRNDQYYEALLTIANNLARLITNRQRAVRLDGVLNEPGRGVQEVGG